MGTVALIGLAASATSKVYGGMQQKRADDQSAALLSTEAGQSVASGIQGANQQRMKGNYIASAARAGIAAGGLTTSGTSAEGTIGAIKGQSEYDALTQVYQGSDRASELNFRAQSQRDEGSAAATAGWISGASTAVSGGESFYSKYGT